MRTVIFLVGIMLRDAILNSPTIEDFYKPMTCVFLAFFMFCFIIADFYELVKK